MKQTKSSDSRRDDHSGISRRRFLAGAVAAAGTAQIIGAPVARAQAETKLKLGVIGNGVRGTWIADLFKRHGGYEIVAAHDYFQDRVDRFGDKFEIRANRRFSGMSGYKQLVETDVDAVAIISPPYCRADQVEAGLAAGKHVYMAKPVAVDVPGSLRIAAAGKNATANNRVCLIDFQTRTNGHYQEAIRRIQEGAIGKVISGESMYHAGVPWKITDGYRENPTDTDERIRGWGLDVALSGDIITEQNIHTIDVATWMLDAHPVEAYGKGGRHARDVGTTWDTYGVLYTFPNDVLISFSSKQYGQGHSDITCRLYGETGTIDTNYFGKVEIRGQKYFKGGSTGNLYTDGAVHNIGKFYDAVVAKDYTNDTMEYGVRSNLTTILGRIAARENRLVTWDEMMKANAPMELNLKGAKA